LFFAALVTVLVLSLAGYVLRNHPRQPKLGRPMILLSGLLILQLVLGLASYLVKFTPHTVALAPLGVVALTTTHVAIGALMLATVLVLTLRIYRMVAPWTPVVAREIVPAHPAGRSEEAPA
ncbi:MAG: hypothetical protein ACE5G0_22405, partial [Rhodothermales bacterium]